MKSYIIDGSLAMRNLSWRRWISMLCWGRRRASMNGGRGSVRAISNKRIELVLMLRISVWGIAIAKDRTIWWR